MNFPIKIDVEILQTDFIQTEILELSENYNIENKSSVKTFILQSVLCLVFIIIILANDKFMNVAVFFPIAFLAFYFLNFLYRFFIGNKDDYNKGIEHLIKSDAAGNTFFKSERGMIVFKEKEIEYLTNLNRRYFSYDKIKHIKITKRLIIFVLKVLKDESIRGFHYMIIPKDCLLEENEDDVYALIEKIKNEYNLQEWIKSEIFD